MNFNVSTYMYYFPNDYFIIVALFYYLLQQKFIIGDFVEVETQHSD